MTPSDSGGADRRPLWEGHIPQHYGEAEALTTMGRNAAPFLAGFSLAVSVQTLSLSDCVVRYRNVCLLLFVLAAVLLILTVQFMYRAQRHRVTPKDLMEWWPDWETHPSKDHLHNILNTEEPKYRRWATAASLLFSAGLACLLAGLTVLVVPRSDSLLRWTAVAVGASVVLGQVIWTICTWWPVLREYRNRRKARRPGRPADAGS